MTNELRDLAKQPFCFWLLANGPFLLPDYSSLHDKTMINQEANWDN